MRNSDVFKVIGVLAMMVFSISSAVSGKSLKAPRGMFKDLNDEIVGDAIIINGKQLFIDDYIIEELAGAQKVLNQPVKHPDNPIFAQETDGYATIIYDEDDKIFKMWYEKWDYKTKNGALHYATSTDGITWRKPVINKQERNNHVFHPQVASFCGAGVMKDPAGRDPARRYKMLYVAKHDGTAKTLSTNVAYSPDGIHWTADPGNPLITFSDTQACAYWDGRLARYVAYLRFGPPNTRIVSRIESEDFVHWSPKVTVLKRGRLDAPFATCFYGMRIMPYENVYIGLITAYHGETIKPIPKDKLWMDRKNVHLAFSRNGLTWSRVGHHGAIPDSELSKDRDWKTIAEQAVFIPYGEYKKGWDWGVIHPFQSQLIVNDEILIYYQGQAGRNWWNFQGDPPKVIPNAQPPDKAIGLATLRLDGFVSIDAEKEGTMTTKPFVFVGDTLEVNANAAGGSILVEALDREGKVIERFAKKDCTAITTDSVRHVLKWNGKADCQLIQARPIRLRFYLKKAKLYSFTPRIRHRHYIPSYSTGPGAEDQEFPHYRRIAGKGNNLNGMQCYAGS